jgi:hypothetical protein
MVGVWGDPPTYKNVLSESLHKEAMDDVTSYFEAM